MKLTDDLRLLETERDEAVKTAGMSTSIAAGGGGQMYWNFERSRVSAETSA